MQEPRFEPVKPLHASHPLTGRIDKAMGTDFRTYVHCRSSDAKSLSMLIGKTIDLNHLSVEWGRPVTQECASVDRPPVDRSSGLYSSRRSVIAKESSSQGSARKSQTPVSAKGTPKVVSNPVSEDVLKCDLYLTSSDEETSPNADGKDTKVSHQDTSVSRAASDSSNNSKTKGVKDLSYWMSCTEKLKAPSTSNSDGPGTPEDQKSQRSSSHEPASRETSFKKETDDDKESVTPKSTEGSAGKYRELLKNGFDSLGFLKAARRSNLSRMLSGMNDSDDEGPNEYSYPAADVKSGKRSKTQSGNRNSARQNTRGSPVSTLREEPKRRGRSPTARSSDRQMANCFVDRKISKSPKRELVPYNDLDDEASDESPHPTATRNKIKTEPSEDHSLNVDHKRGFERKQSPASSPMPSKRRKMEKALPSHDDDVASKRTSKSNGSPTRRPQSIKSEPKVDVKSEVAPKFNFDTNPYVDEYNVEFKVPFGLVSPSHRKRKRRHNGRKSTEEVSFVSSKNDKVPPTKCPVQSSSSHSNYDSDNQHDRLAETGGFHVSSNVNTDPFDVQSPDTDPMVDPTFDRGISDDESEPEMVIPRHIKSSPADHSLSSHRSRVGHTSSHSGSATCPSKGTNVSRLAMQSYDQKQQFNDTSFEKSARSSLINAPEHKLKHSYSASNIVGQSLPPDSNREPDCKKSPDLRVIARSHSPVRGERSMSFKTSPTHDTPSASSLIKFEPSDSSEPMKSSIFSEPSLFKNIKIPRKRPTAPRASDANESKKKRKLTQDQLPSNVEESQSRETTKVKEPKKKSKSKKLKLEPETVKLEPSSSPSRGRFEISVSDSCETERSFSPSPTDNAAPFLPPTTGFSEMATQCELMPASERGDVADSGPHQKRMAVAFRIEGGRGNTPVVSAEMRAQPQTPRSSGQSGAMSSSMSGDSHQQSGSQVVPRRRSSGSNVDDGDLADGADEAAESHGSQRCSHPSELRENLIDAVISHRNQQEMLVHNENIAYYRMNSTQCFTEAAAKKHEADRLKNEEPSRFALYALRACYLFIQACYVEERQGKLENAVMHYRETVQYVRSTSNMIEQVAKVTNTGENNSTRGKLRHHFITLLCAQMKAIINYRIYWLTHRDTARLRQEVERELSRCGAGTGANGASERSTPESLTRSPSAPGSTSSSGSSLHLVGEGHHKLMRYLRQTKNLLAANEYWQHAVGLRAKHGAELKRMEEYVFRRARLECTGPETPVPCFLRYLNTFLTLRENDEL